MSHSEVYKWFELYFPQYAGDKVESWFQNGKNSIRIRQKNHQEFIFTFNNEGNWRFETVESFMNGLKVQLINVNSKMRKNLFYFLTKKGRTFPLVKISFFERY